MANRIAAGEVVERPASVVKELVENSIDADASRIEIKVEAGGKDLIIVTDNGLGMTREEIELSLRRHATSKISSAEDLQHIATLGFRGEALPSIASISCMEIISRTPDNSLGSRVAIDRGEITESGETGAPIGTGVHVRELFFNTPARRKFLKTASTEFGHVADVVERIALSYPRIAFKLSHGSKVHIDLPKVDTYRERLAALWGEEKVGEMLEVEAGESGIAIFGFASPPTTHSGNARNIRFVLNGRPIKNPSLMAAIRRAYEGTLPPGRYPQAVLYLEVDPELVDVNVHPMKLEVRFRRSNEIFKTVVRGLKNAFGPVEIPKSRPVATNTGDFRMRRSEPSPSHFEFEDRKSADFRTVGQQQMPISEREIFATPSFPPLETGDSIEEVVPVFWQIHGTYIFAETKGGFIIIDQHAAHERILFDELKSRIDKGAFAGQRLLFPIAVKITGLQEAVFHEKREMLERLGFEFGPDAPGHILVEAVPQELRRFSKGEALSELLDDIAEGGSVSSAVNDFAAMAACRMAIKAGDILSQEEMGYLFDRLFATESPYTCPHGRPTIIRFKLDELEKRFDRK